MTATTTTNDDGGNAANGPYSIQQFAYAWILLSRFMIVNHLPRLNDELQMYVCLFVCVFVCGFVCIKCVAHGAITSQHCMGSKKRSNTSKGWFAHSHQISISISLFCSLFYACLMKIQSKHTLHYNFKWIFHLIFI